MVLTPRQLMSLLDHFSDVAEAWTASAAQLQIVPGFERRIDDFLKRRERVNLSKELEDIERFKLHVLTLEDDHYPAPLRGVKYPPPVLYAYGKYLEQDQWALGVVGTRRMSNYGRQMTEQLSFSLAERGITIVSGLALGVDTVSHESALKAKGRTIAVLGSGFGKLYPAQNRNLAHAVADAGVVFSEFPIHTEPARWTFPRRNRVISGLSRGVLVVEAPIKSGALITAKEAIEQGREVFAVPGQAIHPNSKGCHHLIKNGAKLVEDVDDILEEWPQFNRVSVPEKPVETPLPESLTPLQRDVLQALSFDPCHVNTVIETTDASVAEVSSALVELEMLGLVNEVESKHYVKRVEVGTK